MNKIYLQSSKMLCIYLAAGSGNENKGPSDWPVVQRRSFGRGARSIDTS